MAYLESDQPPNKTALDMSMIAGGALDRLTFQTNAAEASITQPDEWPAAMGYAPWVEEIWANYISNALKYGGSPPVIALGAEKQDGMVRYWVKDNGIGLTEAERESLFAEFFRLDTHLDKKGHGVGLSIVGRIAHKLDGDVGVESEVGKGSTFYFTLPAA